ncbi:MAG: hypothetical protein HYZ73_01135 [Elusimicrobia bacterium]|nr:hypothetical protein [Elusimicrobiota bacterium]
MTIQTSRDRWLWGLLLVVAGLYLFRLGAVGLYEPAEGRYAEIARTMVTSGDWVIPRLNGVRYFEKPPLLYWTTAVSFQWFGLNEFAARLPTALAALVGIVATVMLGMTLGRESACPESRAEPALSEVEGSRDRGVGVRAGLILATSLGYFLFARVVRPDMWLIAGLTVGLLFLVRGFLGRGHPRTWSVGVGLALGITVLAKGAIGVAIPLGVLGVFRILSRRSVVGRGQRGRLEQWGGLRRFSLWWGLGVFLAVVLPWHVWIAVRDSQFFWFYVVNEHLMRFVNHRVHSDATPLPILLFWLVSGVWAFPWATLLPVAWVERRLWIPWRHASRLDRAFNLVGLWAVVVVGIFTASASRAEYYALPALPAVAVLVGKFWAEIDAKRIVLTSPARWIPAVVYLVLGVVGVLVFKQVVLPGRVEAMAWGEMIQRVFLSVPFATSLGIPTQELNEAGIWQALRISLGVLLVTGAFAAFSMHRRRSCMRTLAISMIPLLCLTQQGFQLFEPVWSSKVLAQQLAPRLSPGTPIVVDGPFENANSLGFYLNRPSPLVIYRGVMWDLAFGSTYPEAQPMFLKKRRDLAHWATTQRSFCLITEAEEGWAKFQEILPTAVATPVAKSCRKVAYLVQ